MPPIGLDVGTDNKEHLTDPPLGWRHERIGEADDFAFIAEFAAAIKAERPGVLLQQGDFAKPHARPILGEFVDHLCTFNDDIQGTAAVVPGTARPTPRSSPRPGHRATPRRRSTIRSGHSSRRSGEIAR